jgi:hypothetical protein
MECSYTVILMGTNGQVVSSCCNMYSQM